MDDDPRNYAPRKPGRRFYLGWVVAVIVAVAGTAGLVAARSLWLQRAASEREAEVARGQRVLVREVGPAPRSRSLDLPGEIHGYIETPVYAKIPGYLEEIRVDKGDRVKRGQVIALLASPELDQQVANARAAYNLAAITDRRNQTLARQSVIAEQTADDSHTAMLQAKATYEQLAATQAYETIRAPFSGVVTARYADPGKLIPQATGGTTAEMPLIAMATLRPVRVYAHVPQSVAPFIKDGDPATVSVTDYPERVFDGSVTRHPDALDPATRTMLVEVDLPNEDLALYPGMYARVQFQVGITTRVPIVPDDALIFRDGKPYVPVVRANRLHLAPVTLGYDDGINVQVTRGVVIGDLVAVNVGQSARDGEPVQPVREGIN
ncbi:MAG TPA: efflux RND transporter periplasmic adaptor subunit [Candidatus Binataceae bacterium]|jgi:RND family efflux transporter MFP subunit|nr:efflux RND transporter periplasmic adaptor subunit [Candidatus Binataceae bacterium]